MTNGADGGRVIIVWIAKCGAVVFPSSILPRIWMTHPATAFTLGLVIGVLAQHFIPPPICGLRIAAMARLRRCKQVTVLC